MRSRTWLLSVVALAAVLAATAPAAQAEDPPFDLTVTWAQPITTTNDSATFAFTTNRTGTYDLTWYLYDPVGSDPAPVLTGSVTGGQIEADGAIPPLVISGADLSDGRYDFSAQLVVYADSGETFTRTLMKWGSDDLVVDRQAPTSTRVIRPRSVIYPRIATTRYPGDVEITFDGGFDEFDVPHLAVMDGSTEVGRLNGEFIYNHDVLFRFNGRVGTYGNTRLLPAKTYRLALVDAVGNLGSETSVTVSKLRPVLWKKTVRPAASVVDRHIGRCSTLRKPVLGRPWVGSFGYYANTRCGAQTRASLVSTLHRVRVPAAHDYGGLHVAAYGGAAKSRPGSQAVIGLINNDGRWRFETLMRPRVALHRGDGTTQVRNFLRNRYVYWGFYSGHGHRYDVRDFTVSVVLYKYD